MNTLYEVEIKSTLKRPSIWTYSKSRLDQLRSLHSDAILVIYVQNSHEFFTQFVRAIDWPALQVGVGPYGQYYRTDLNGFVTMPEIFRLISNEGYRAFLKDSGAVLRDFNVPNFQVVEPKLKPR